jgi:hypothetical protein
MFLCYEVMSNSVIQAIPRKRFYDVVMKNEIALPFGSMALTSILGKLAPDCGLGYVGEARLTPDLSTKRTIPWYTCSFFTDIIL